MPVSDLGITGHIYSLPKKWQKGLRNMSREQLTHITSKSQIRRHKDPIHNLTI